MSKRASAAARGYDKDWWRLRHAFLRANPLCELCKQLDPPKTTPASVVDHIKPIKQRPDLRLDPRNLRAVCKPCHDAAIQSWNRTGVMRGCDTQGNPLDPPEHWK